MEFALKLDYRKNVPLYRILAEAIKAAISSGQIAPGEELPSIRQMADMYCTSPATVIRCYDDLSSQGFLDTAPRSKTRVSKNPPLEGESKTSDPAEPLRKTLEPAWSAHGKRLIEARKRSLSHKGVAIYNPGREDLPVAAWNKMILRHNKCYIQDDGALTYSADPFGHLRLREAVAAYLKRARGINCEADTIVMSSNSRLDLIAKLFIDSGDRVIVEEPCYPAVRRILLSYGAELVPVPVDQDGIIIDRFVNSGDRFKMIHLCPSHHDPTGAVLSMERRLELLEWARDTGTFIFENDFDSHFRYGTKPIPALKGLDGTGSVIYASSFWMAMGPLVRLGYLAVPQKFVATIQCLQDVVNRDISVIEQYALTDFINEGFLERHVHRTRVKYTRRRQALIFALKTGLGDAVTINKESAGMHLLVNFGAEVSEERIEEAAQESDFFIKPTSDYYMTEPKQGEYIIPFVGLDESTIEDTVRRFVSALG